PFGHGLSYTRFAYSKLRLDRGSGAAEQPVRVSVQVANSGQRPGDEVVQLYLRPLEPRRERARKELRGFQRISLQPGEVRTLEFEFTPAADLSHYEEARRRHEVDAGAYEVQVGASSADIRLTGKY